MHYIVIDLEWNQCPYGKEKENKELPFEIIEIGAVKLGKDRKVIDTFSEIVKPQVYQTLNKVTQEVIGITNEELQKGAPFPIVMKEFLNWCGEDMIYCTWGNIDLLELQRNMEYYNIPPLAKKTILYYDVQRLCRVVYPEIKESKTLEYMVDYVKIEKKEEFHRAIFDAQYTAEIFRKLDWSLVKNYYCIDSYIKPKSKQEEVYKVYRSHSKYISMEHEQTHELWEDKDIRSLRCCKCGRNTIRKIRWFSYNTKQYYSLGYCKEHGYVKGKIRIKETKEGKYFVLKTIKMSEKEEAEHLNKKKEDLKSKRREKRNKKKKED